VIEGDRDDPALLMERARNGIMAAGLLRRCDGH
jgi:hypothetical protein